MWAKIDSDTKDRFEKKAKAAKEKYEEDYKVNLKTVLFKGDFCHFWTAQWYVFIFSASPSTLSDQSPKNNLYFAGMARRRGCRSTEGC